MPASEDEDDRAFADTQALAAEPDSAELAKFGHLVESLDPRSQPPRLAPGTQLTDAFEIEEALGAGGMGIVYRARDLRLGRPVAVKLHRPMAKGTERLLREAAAMAKLNHPNVATVHEVGTHDGMLFIAMELIDGVTARRWVTSTEREPLDVVRLYCAAGQGLAAAHRAGLVHRDFKPENVLVGLDDVPRVVDFGLARPVDHVPLDAAVGTLSLSTDPENLTVTGAVVGTPAYMAPEQFDGGDVDARADQFSFCVSLYEALYGERPFAGRSALQLLSSMVQGTIQPPPSGTRVPASVRRVLVRGLATTPDQRWESMDTLLEQLQRLVTPRRRRWIAVGLTVGLAALGGGLAYGEYLQLKDRCTGAATALAGVWDEARRQDVKTAILGTELSYAPGTWERVEQRLDGYTQAWRSKHLEVCEATSVRDEQSAEVMDLRMECLRQRRVGLNAAVKVLADADATVVENAVKLTTSLPELARCDDLEALRAAVPPPEDPEVAREVQQLREQLADIGAEREAGRYGPALQRVELVVERAQALEYGPLLAETQFWRGFLRSDSGEYAEAERDLVKAHELAMEHRHYDVALIAVLHLTFVVGTQQQRHAEGRVWGRAAMAHAKRSGADQDMAKSLTHLGLLLHAQGEYDQAKLHFERALRIQEKALGADHPAVAKSLGNLGLVLHSQGEYERAKLDYERALQILEKALGAEHPDVAIGLNNLGLVHQVQGEYEQAKLDYERALQIREKALGADHPMVANSLGNLGIVFGIQGDYERAKLHFERALRIREKALGPEHPDVAKSLNNLGNVLRMQGEYERAKLDYERALHIQEKALGADHPTVASNLNNLGLVLLAQGELEQAKLDYERALQIQEETLGAEHPTVAASLGNLGSVYSRQGEYERAKLHYERALHILEKALGADHPRLAISLGNLGLVLLTQGEHEQAKLHYERALRIREKALGPDHPDVARPLAGLATIAIEQRDFETARAHAERAVSILGEDKAAPEQLAEARFALARALWPDRARRARARELAQQARDAFAEHGAGKGEELAEIEQWLVKHR